MSGDFENKVVIVTGGCGGIGSAIVRKFLSAGAKVLMTDSAEQKLSEVFSDMKKDFGGKVASFVADMREAYAVAPRVVDFTLKNLGEVDILVNCAGIYPSKIALDITEEDWDKTYDLNVKGYFFMAQAAAKSMVQHKKKGCLINITSTASEVARPGVAHYCSSKAAVKMMTQVLALEWAQYGIRVNAFGPGLVETETLMATLITDKAKAEHKEKVTFIPLGRSGAAEEMAEAVAFLASDDACYITGQSLFADGGYAAGRTYQSMK